MGRRMGRGARTGKRKRERADNAGEEPRVRATPHFGSIPLLVKHWTDADGTERAGFIFDPDHAPPLPDGAIRGNPRRQNLSVFDVPRYYYLDASRDCVQCGDTFIFSAAEQKHWYETLQFSLASVAIRCAPCRKLRRSAKALHGAVEEAKRLVALEPHHPPAQLALAEALITLNERLQRGSLNQALTATRKARRLLRDASPADRALTFYWEGRAQALADRLDAARVAYGHFLEGRAGKHHRALARQVERWLAGEP